MRWTPLVDPAVVLGETLVVLLNESLRWWKVSQGYRFGQLDRPEEAVAVHDQVVDRFGEDAAPALREPVATARRLRTDSEGED